MLRFPVGDGLCLEAARDCLGQPRLLRLDDAFGLPRQLDQALCRLASPVRFSPDFFWIEIPERYRIYRVNGNTLRFVFRQRAARSHAIEALDLLRHAYADAGREKCNFLPRELQEVLHQWDNEPINC